MFRSGRILAFLYLWCGVAFGQQIHGPMPDLSGFAPRHWSHTMALPGNTATMTSTGSASSQINFVPSFSDCVSVNCFHVNTTAPFVASQIFSSNRVTFAIDTANTGWQLTDYQTGNPGAYKWVQHSEWGKVYGIQADSSGKIWALESGKDSYCASIGGGHAIGLWTGSSWILETYCFNQLIMAQDGSNAILAIDPNGTLWNNLGGTWQHAPMPFGKMAISASWSNGHANTYDVVTNDNGLWTYSGSAWMQLGSLPSPAASVGYDSNYGDNLYYIGTNANLYYLDQAAGGWDKLILPGTIEVAYGHLANGGSGNVWIVGPTNGGNNVYRFSDQALQHTRIANGNITCTPIPPFNQSVCQSFTHTITWQAGLGTHFGKQFSYSFLGANSWNANASFNQDDVFAVIENPDDYEPTVEGDVNCSEEGNLFDDSITLKMYHILAVTSQEANTGPNGAPYQERGWLMWYQNYNAAPACTAATTPPDLFKTPIKEAANQNPAGWEMFSPACVTFAPPGSQAGTWRCLRAFAVESLTAIDPNYDCDYHNNVGQ